MYIKLSGGDIMGFGLLGFGIAFGALCIIGCIE